MNYDKEIEIIKQRAFDKGRMNGVIITLLIVTIAIVLVLKSITITQNQVNSLVFLCDLFIYRKTQRISVRFCVNPIHNYKRLSPKYILYLFVYTTPSESLDTYTFQRCRFQTKFRLFFDVFSPGQINLIELIIQKNATDFCIIIFGVLNLIFYICIIQELKIWIKI